MGGARLMGYLVAAIVGGLVGMGLLWIIGQFVDYATWWDERE